MRSITTTTLLALLATQAAETAVIDLSCDGTMRNLRDETAKPKPTEKIGLVVNLAEHTVSGFGVVAHIDNADNATVKFNSEDITPDRTVVVSVKGEIDRVTGKTWVIHETEIEVDNERIKASYGYNLVCKVTNRLF
jgi:hypothetical protein